MITTLVCPDIYGLEEEVCGTMANNVNLIHKKEIILQY